MDPPAQEVTSAPSIYTSSGWLAVPANAIELLRDSIKSPKGDAAERIRKAAAIICESAHSAEANPEHVLVAIKEICHSLPEYERIKGARERDAFIEVVVRTAIEEYYRT